MRVLFDQATPVPIRPHLEGHAVRTAAQQGWDTLKNGDLLAAAEAAGFDLVLTTDKNMRYQQTLQVVKSRSRFLACSNSPNFARMFSASWKPETRIHQGAI